MDVILCPTLLFIEENEWNNKETYDIFFSCLNKMIEYVNTNDVSIYWNDALENLLWCEPNLHPWIAPYNSSIISFFYNRIRRINDSLDFVPCQCTPNIIHNITSKDIITPTLSLFHYFISKGSSEKIGFIVDENNNKDFVFSCMCHYNNLMPETIYLMNPIIDLPQEVSKRWDNIKSDTSLLDELLELCRKKYFDDKQFKYRVSYETSFIRDIVKINESKEKLIHAITSRLTLNPDEVSRIKGFHDEEIDENNRSFRVDKVCRVYYDYGDNNTIIFKKYTGSSEHDKGTRHT